MVLLSTQHVRRANNYYNAPVYAYVSNNKYPDAMKRDKNHKSSYNAKGGDDILGQSDTFSIPIPRSITLILIPIWFLTLLYPIITAYNNESETRVVYSFLPFLGIGILIFLMIRLLCPKEIVTTDEGAIVKYRGQRRYLIPWNLMVLVPRKPTLAYGFEALVGVCMKGHPRAYVESPIEVADALKKKKESISSGPRTSK